jgi:hypothetical protein
MIWFNMFNELLISFRLFKTFMIRVCSCILWITNNRFGSSIRNTTWEIFIIDLFSRNKSLISSSICNLIISCQKVSISKSGISNLIVACSRLYSTANRFQHSLTLWMILESWSLLRGSDSRMVSEWEMSTLIFSSISISFFSSSEVAR